MPIYAPSLPPQPDLSQGDPPALVLARFDLRRILRLKLGRFFGFCFVLVLIYDLLSLYVRYLMNSNPTFSQAQGFAKGVMTQGADYQADHIGIFMLVLLWLQVAMVCGGLIARDSLYRIRPLLYAHPVRPMDYLAAKLGVAAGLPFLIMLPFILLPWGMSLLIAGQAGPVWATLPLHLLPAALVVALLMGCVTLGASALAGGPRAAFGWVVGIVAGTFALGSILWGVLDNSAWLAISPAALAAAWPKLACGVESPALGWLPTIAGTLFHVGFGLGIAALRTRPSEAVM